MNRYDRSRQGLAICLAGLAGYVDAIGFLSAHGYFVSFMSGNTTRLAVDLVTDPATAIVPGLLILGFVTGVTAGAIIGMAADRHRKPVILGIVALLLLGAAAASAVQRNNPAMALVVLAMGVLNNVFQRDGEVSVGVTYMTGALVRFGQGVANRLTGRGRGGWLSYLLLWLGLATGGVTGAATFSAIAGTALWPAAAVTALLALYALHLVRRESAGV